MKPGNIWSGSNTPLLAALTNPTCLARRKGKIGRDYPVTDTTGKVWADAESAYKSYKTGDTPEDMRRMTRIIAAKLRQHPRLTKAITKAGGVPWLQQCSHTVTGRSRWEGYGRNSRFICCLIAAYEQQL
ncbi:MAG: hypothetical protein ACO3YZ_03595 [Candidatus Nanopelagicaceae bacterium]